MQKPFSIKTRIISGLYPVDFCESWKTLIVFVFIVLSPISSFGQELPELKSIIDAWRTRQGTLSSARFTWKEVRTLRAGAVRNGASGNKSNLKGTMIPEKDVTLSVHHKLSFKEEMVRYEYQGVIWDPNKSAPVNQDSISVFDGTTAKTFMKPMALGNPRGWIQKTVKNMNVWHIHTRPLLFVYRPFHAQLHHVTSSNLQVTNRQDLIRDKLCVVLQQNANPSKNNNELIWVALQADYPILRIQETVDGMVSSQTDFFYSTDSTHGHMLTKWQHVRLSPEGKMIQSSTSTVDQYEVNIRMNTEEFQFDFPPGTFVSDQKKSAGSANEFYIVNEKGTKRAVSRSELTAKTYDEIAFGNNNGSPKLAFIRQWWFLSFIALLGLSFILLKRWKRGVH